MNAPFQMPRATIDDLMRYDGKAELIGGRIVTIMSPGHRPLLTAFEIAKALEAGMIGRGIAYGEGMIFSVPVLASGRESFVPDAAFVAGPPPADPDDCYPGPPAFAVEVRSKNGYGPAAETLAALKRADYFEAGTLVVWDVNPRQRAIHCYSAADPLTPKVFGPGDEADAEPAVPGWRVMVDDILK